MSLFYDTELLEEMEFLVDCLIEDKTYYTASLIIDSQTKKPRIEISNGEIMLRITRRDKNRLHYVFRDESVVRQARMEGFSEEQIRSDIKCFRTVDDPKTAELILTKKGFWREMKAEVMKERAKNEENNT